MPSFIYQNVVNLTVHFPVRRSSLVCINVVMWTFSFPMWQSLLL